MGFLMNSAQISMLAVKVHNGSDQVEYILPAALFDRLLKAAVRSVVVDEEWYKTRYSDVANAFDRGLIKSCAEHYRRDGYKENRQPFPIKIDEAYYLLYNPDVAKAIEEKKFASAQEHFDVSGFLEGRLPHDGFALF